MRTIEELENEARNAHIGDRLFCARIDVLNVTKVQSKQEEDLLDVYIEATQPRSTNPNNTVFCTKTHYIIDRKRLVSELQSVLRDNDEEA